MSWDVWRGVCVYHGAPDPGPSQSPEPVTPSEAEASTELNMLRGQVLYLHYKMNEHLEKSTPKPKRKARGLDGIPL